MNVTRCFLDDALHCKVQTCSRSPHLDYPTLFITSQLPTAIATEECKELHSCLLPQLPQVSSCKLEHPPEVGFMDYYTHRSPHPHPPPPASPEPKMQPSVGYGAIPEAIRPSDDVVLYVGKRRLAYHINAESLMRGSAYFRNLLQHANPKAHQPGRSPHPVWPSLVMDCEEGIFENMLLLMRYGTLEALPPMSASETYQLKKEADFYGISYVEPCRSRQSSSGDSSSEVSCTSSPRSTACGSPKSAMNISPPSTPQAKHTSGRRHGGVRLACNTPQQGLEELPEFPRDLAEPGRLLLVSCLDAERAKFYNCDCGRVGGGGATQWALNFHYRHAFCTACGEAPKMSAKNFAEMFMAAAAHHTTEHGGAAAAQAAKWQVGCDSTCLLRFVSSAGDGPDACACATGGARAGKEAPATIWAASCYHSHAFCTGCTAAAKGPVLLSLMLALRYGGGNKGSRSSRSAFAPPAHSRYLGQ